MQTDIRYLPRVAFWLVPRRHDREKLQSHITSLALRYSAPIFVPHVTVYSCRRTLSQRELALAAGLARTCRPIVLNALGLSGKTRLSQTLFIRLQENAALLELNRSLHRGVEQPSNYKLDPHLSLLYQDIPVDVRETLTRDISVPLAKISFEELWAVAIPDQLNAIGDFDGWQNLLICRLDS